MKKKKKQMRRKSIFHRYVQRSGSFQWIKKGDTESFCTSLFNYKRLRWNRRSSVFQPLQCKCQSWYRPNLPILLVWPLQISDPHTKYIPFFTLTPHALVFQCHYTTVPSGQRYTLLSQRSTDHPCVAPHQIHTFMHSCLCNAHTFFFLSPSVSLRSPVSALYPFIFT